MESLWKLAKSIEMEGKKLYEELAFSASKEEISGAFFALAREEKRHYEIFDRFENALPVESFVIKSGNGNITKLFNEIRTEIKNEEPAREDAETTYKKALILENRSIDLYKKMLLELTNEHQKGIVAVIIEEEYRHIQVLNDLIEFVHRPKEWLENAEIYHLEEY